MDPAFKPALESSFAAPSGVDLRFYGHAGRARTKKVLGNGLGVFRCITSLAGRNGYAMGGQELPGLIFV